MKYALSIAVMTLVFAPPSHGQQQSNQDPAAQAVRERIRAYVSTFNQHDAAAVAAFWTQDAEAVDEESGDRTIGRESLQSEFEQFFADFPDSQLSGGIERLRMIGSDVCIAEGQVTLAAGEEPTPSAFTAVLVRQDGQWLFASSHERELPSPPTSYDALRELEWLVGNWRDETDEARVSTSVRWSANRAFLIRSFAAEFDDGEMLQGTQIIGWDPAAKQVRTWVFNSDGSFGSGTASKNGEDWMVRMVHTQSDGRLAASTQVISRIDDDTLEIQTIGETIDGLPVPASDPVTVVRVDAEDAASDSEEASSQGATQ